MIKDDQVCGYVLSNLMEEVRQNRSQSIVDIPALRAKYTAALAQYVNKRKSMGLEVDEESSSQPSLKQLGPGKPAAKSKGTPTQGPKKPVPPKPTDGRIYTWCPYHFKWEQRKSADKCHFATLCTHIKPTETRNAHERNCPLKESCPCAPKKPTTGSGPRGNPKGQKRGQDDLEKELEMAERRVQQLKDQKNAKHQKINSCKEPEDSLMVLDDDDGSEGKPSPKGHWWASVQQRLNLKELDSTVESEEKNSKSGGQNEVVDVDAMDVDVDEPNCGASMSSAKGVGSTNERTGGTSTTADTGATVHVKGQKVTGIADNEVKVDAMAEIVQEVNGMKFHLRKVRIIKALTENLFSVGTQLDSQGGAFITTLDGMYYAKAPYKVWHMVAERQPGREYKLLECDVTRKPKQFIDLVSEKDRKVMQSLSVTKDTQVEGEESLTSRYFYIDESSVAPTIDELRQDQEKVKEKIDRNDEKSAAGPGVDLGIMGDTLLKHSSQIEGATMDGDAVPLAAEDD
ncbi:hypothetical protein HDU99_004527, partial [Rhizoclosmatium hyalinum]